MQEEISSSWGFPKPLDIKIKEVKFLKISHWDCSRKENLSLYADRLGRHLGPVNQTRKMKKKKIKKHKQIVTSYKSFVTVYVSSWKGFRNLTHVIPCY